MNTIGEVGRKATICALMILFAETAVFADVKVPSVSLINLISNGAEYIGKRVTVSGFILHKFNYYLFVTKDHANILDYASSIRISETDDGAIFESRCFDAYVTVTGKIISNLPEDDGLTMVYVESVYNHDKDQLCW